MHLPLRIVQIGDRRTNRAEHTRDIGSGGVCFLSAASLETGERVEYVVTLSRDTPAVCLRCAGKVVRSQWQPGRIPTDGGYAVAMTMDRYQFIRPTEPKPEEVSV